MVSANASLRVTSCRISTCPLVPMGGFIAVTKSQYYAPVIILTMSMLHGRRVFGFCLNMTFRSAITTQRLNMFEETDGEEV